MKDLINEVARVLNEPLPRSRRQGFSIVVPDARDEEEFRFSFEYYHLGLLVVEYRVDAKNSLQYNRIVTTAVAGAEPEAIAKEIVAAIKEAPEKYRNFFERCENQQQELAAAA